MADTPTGWVVVGVDGSASSRYALDGQHMRRGCAGSGCASSPPWRSPTRGTRSLARPSPPTSKNSPCSKTRAPSWTTPTDGSSGSTRNWKPAPGSHSAAPPKRSWKPRKNRGPNSSSSARGAAAPSPRPSPDGRVELAAHSPVPVVVLPKEHETAPGVRERVVLGVDGSPASRNAIDFAFAEAQRRGTELVVVCAWAAHHRLRVDHGAASPRSSTKNRSPKPPSKPSKKPSPTTGSATPTSPSPSAPSAPTRPRACWKPPPRPT